TFASRFLPAQDRNPPLPIESPLLLHSGGLYAWTHVKNTYQVFPPGLLAQSYPIPLESGPHISAHSRENQDAATPLRRHKEPALLQLQPYLAEGVEVVSPLRREFGIAEAEP